MHKFMLNYKRQILLPLLMASVILAVAMGWLFFTAYHLIDASGLKDKIEEARIEISNLKSTIVDAETGQRGYLLTGNVAFLEPYHNGLENSSKLIAKLSERVDDIPELKPVMSNLKILIETKFRIIKVSLEIQLHAGSYASHLTLSRDQGQVVMNQIRAELQKADGELQNRNRQIELQINRSLRQAIFGSAMLAIVITSVLWMGYQRTLKLFEQIINTQKIADELGYQAAYDMLTNIPNRRGFDEHLRRVFALSERGHEDFAVFYMDLDGFKAINDKFGHDAGDEALIEVTRRFTHVMRGADFLARLGGDEFAAIIQKYKNSAELKALANRMIRSLEPPIHLVGGHEASIGVSIGVARYPANGNSVDLLVSAADSEMYRAKASGKNKVYFAAGGGAVSADG